MKPKIQSREQGFCFVFFFHVLGGFGRAFLHVPGFLGYLRKGHLQLTIPDVTMKQVSRCVVIPVTTPESYPAIERQKMVAKQCLN